MVPLLITFVRHGETAENADKTIQGWTPTDLNATGRRQAHACGAWLADNYREACAIVTSDLPRAHSTATAIHAAYGSALPFTVTPLLRERRLGVFETRKSHEARDYDPDLADAYKGPLFYDAIGDRYPESRVETREEFLARGKAALREVLDLGAQHAAALAAQPGGGKDRMAHVLVVSHGQILRVITSLLLANPHLLPEGPEGVAEFYAPTSPIGPRFAWSGDKLFNTALTRILLQVEDGAPDGRPRYFTPPTLLVRNATPHLRPTDFMVVTDARGGSE
jgi:broad specificity phosphatase PhoE